MANRSEEDRLAKMRERSKEEDHVRALQHEYEQNQQRTDDHGKARLKAIAAELRQRGAEVPKEENRASTTNASGGRVTR